MLLKNRMLWSVALLLSCAVGSAVGAENQKTEWQFSFGTGKAGTGVTQVGRGICTPRIVGTAMSRAMCRR